MKTERKFIVTVMIPYIPEDVKQEVLERERKRVQILKQEGIVHELFVGETMKNVWMIISAENEDKVQEIMETLPIYPYLYIDRVFQLVSQV